MFVSLKKIPSLLSVQDFFHCEATKSYTSCILLCFLSLISADIKHMTVPIEITRLLLFALRD